MKTKLCGCHAKERQWNEGFTHIMLLLSGNSNLITCRKEWPTASGFICCPKFPVSRTSYGFLAKLDFICQDTPIRRIRAYWLLQTLTPFTESGLWYALSRTNAIYPVASTQPSKLTSTSTFSKTLWLKWKTGSWYSVIFNIMEWLVIGLTGPWKK
jgi:hypothetical protein